MMTISTKGRYGLRMLVDIAACTDGKENMFVPLTDIAKRQRISKKYLEQIAPIFVKAGVLRTVRGAQGGYALAKTADAYTVGQLLRLTEGDFCVVPCAAQDAVDCERSADCATAFVWQGLYRLLNDYLDGITLRDILDRQREHDTYDYVI